MDGNDGQEEFKLKNKIWCSDRTCQEQDIQESDFAHLYNLFLWYAQKAQKEYKYETKNDVLLCTFSLQNDPEKGLLLLGSICSSENNKDVFFKDVQEILATLSTKKITQKDQESTDLLFFEYESCSVLYIPPRAWKGAKHFRDALFPEKQVLVSYWSSFSDLARHAPLGPKSDVLSHRYVKDPGLKIDLEAAFQKFQQHVLDNPQDFEFSDDDN